MVEKLQLSSQYAEDPLSQGINKLKMVLAERIAAEITVVESTNFSAQMAATMEILEALQRFVNQVSLQHIVFFILSGFSSVFGLCICSLHEPSYSHMYLHSRPFFLCFTNIQILAKQRKLVSFCI